MGNLDQIKNSMNLLDQEEIYLEKKEFTDSNIKDRNIKGISQISIQQAISSSNSGDNY